MEDAGEMKTNKSTQIEYLEVELKFKEKEL